MKPGLKGLRVLLTGAAGGVGSSLARALADEGCSLVLTGRNQEKLETLVGEIGGPGRRGRFHVIPTDLSDPTACAALPALAAEALGGLDVLINNAGLAVQKSVRETGVELWDRIMAVNARAPFILSRESLPFLEVSDSPRIVNISSVVGTRGYDNQAAYAASKHALNGFSKVLAREIHDKGIGVHLIEPGGIATPMVQEMRPDIDPSDQITPEEVAELICFLLKNRGGGFIDRVALRRKGKKPW